jgi:hypothetical protein
MAGKNKSCFLRRGFRSIRENPVYYSAGTVFSRLPSLRPLP